MQDAKIRLYVEQPLAPGQAVALSQDQAHDLMTQVLEGRVSDIAKISATDESFWLATQKHALRKWRFRPATRDGVAVSSVKTLTVRFTLTDR